MKSLPNLHVRWKLYRRMRKKLKLLTGADVVLTAYAKSGRTWLSVMISHLVHQKFGTPANELITSSEFRRQYPQVPSFFFTADNFAPPSMSEEALLDLYKTRKVILLVRDPRDIAVSSYFQFSKRASLLARAVSGMPENLGDMPLFDFMCDETLGLPRVVAWLNRWQGRIEKIPESRVISYEQLRAETAKTLAGVADFIGWQCSDEEIGAAVEFASFDNMKALEQQRFFQSRKMQPRDSADPDTFKVRRGKVSGYRDHFDPQQTAIIDQIVAERLSPKFTKIYS